jgi:hypothetical protein
LLSTAIGCPKASLIACATTRPTVSVALPAGNGTMNFMGLVGYVCAEAFTPVKANNPAMQLLAKTLKVFFIDVSFNFKTMQIIA